MLANSAKRYNFISDLQKQMDADQELLKSLVAILDSPIHTVRRLTAKCIFNIFPFELIYGFFQNMNYQTENLLHGALLLFKLCYQYYHSHSLFDSEIKYLEDKFKVILDSKGHSYWSREVFDSTVTCSNDLTTKGLESILSEAESSSNALGMAIWLKINIENYIHLGSWENMPKCLKTLLNHNDYECYCEFLFKKLETDRQIPEEVLKEIANILMSFEKKYNSSVTWKILYHISLKVELTNVDVSEMIKKMEGEITYKLRYIIPFIMRVLKRRNVEEQQQRFLQNIILKLSDFENADFDLRYIAVLANNELAHNFENLSDEVKMVSITTAVLLLQDEDEDIRNVCVNYYKNIKNLKTAVHSNICLNGILERQFLQETFSNSEIINVLCQNILKCVSTNLHSIDEDNPFANDSKNIYLEVNVLKTLIKNIIE